MSSSRALKFWKCSIYFYIIFFSVTGVFLGSLTSFILIQSFGLRQFYAPVQCPIYFLYAPTVLIFVGSAIAWSAVRKKRVVLLKCFSIIQVLIILLELSGSIWNFTAMQLIHDAAQPIFEEKFLELLKSHRGEIWDTLQRKLRCCGVHGAFDYKTLNVVPFSCCSRAATGERPAFCASLHHVGCLDALADDISRDFAILAVVTAIVAVFQIPGVFASWCFAVRLRRERSMDRRRNASHRLLLDKSKRTPVEGSLIQETPA